jgi:UDP-2-acetamido-2-deoxy-ribo-hexuluronate aminotransferase
MDLLIDVNVIIDVCSGRKPHAEVSTAALILGNKSLATLWVYVGSLQTMEYNLIYELKRESQRQVQAKTNQELAWNAREVLKAFTADKQWLAALPAEGNVFDSSDPEDEQLIRSLDRFPEGSIKLLTRDEELLKNYPSKTISPIQYCQQATKKRHIDFANLNIQQNKIRPQLEQNIHKVLHHGHYIMGSEIKELEQELQAFTGVKHAITCSSGTDALLLAMMAMDIQPGDEIITTPFTFIATAETIVLMKAKPVFVDIEEDTFNIDATKIEAAITDKTKAIMPVSLYGQPADMDAIQDIANRHGLKVIIDGAQSFGATYKGKTDSNLGDISTTSFFPAKPLGCYGDGGAVFTNNDDYAEKMKMMRVHGQNKRYHHKVIGMGGRLDTLQAAILLAKLPHYQQELEARQQVAQSYTDVLSSSLQTPIIQSDRTCAWAQYTIRVSGRDDLQAALKDKGIPTAVHYPMPLHLQECFLYLNYKKGDFPVAEQASIEVMSLPMNPLLTPKEIQYICKNLES